MIATGFLIMTRPDPHPSASFGSGTGTVQVLLQIVFNDQQ
jgi:hypothetical protein